MGPTCLSDEEQRFVLENEGKMAVKTIAKTLGWSASQISKVRYRAGLVRSRVIPAEIRENALRYYETHGKQKAQEAFPQVKILQLAKRYPHKPLHWKWDDKSSIELARMAGFLSFADQIPFLDRPSKMLTGDVVRVRWNSVMRATKNSRAGCQSIHGLSFYVAKKICRPNPPRYFYAYQRRFSHQPSLFGQEHRGVRRSVVLWCDLERWILPDLPPFLTEMVRTLADFQRWLFETDDPRAAIDELVRARTGAGSRPEEEDDALRQSAVDRGAGP